MMDASSITASSSVTSDSESNEWNEADLSTDFNASHSVPPSNATEPTFLITSDSFSLYRKLEKLASELTTIEDYSFLCRAPWIENKIENILATLQTLLEKVWTISNRYLSITSSYPIPVMTSPPSFSTDWMECINDRISKAMELIDHGLTWYQRNPEEYIQASPFYKALRYTKEETTEDEEETLTDQDSETPVSTPQPTQSAFFLHPFYDFILKDAQCQNHLMNLSTRKQIYTNYRLLFLPYLHCKFFSLKKLDMSFLEKDIEIQQSLLYQWAFKPQKSNFSLKDIVQALYEGSIHFRHFNDEALPHPYEYELNELQWKHPMRGFTHQPIKTHIRYNSISFTRDPTIGGLLTSITNPIKPGPFKTTAWTWINTISQVPKVVEKLRESAYPLIAIDVEYSNRTYRGSICLIQISCVEHTFIIDALNLQNDLQELNLILTDPGILKILHGAEMDIIWLQQFCCLYIVNMFDTGVAAAELKVPGGNSLANLLKHYCGIVADKVMQRADWTIRPLPTRMLNYARCDTHYLIYIFGTMKNQLLSRPSFSLHNQKTKTSNNNPCFINLFNVLNRSRFICLKVYSDNKTYADTKKSYVRNSIKKWLDDISRFYNITPTIILTKRQMQYCTNEKNSLRQIKRLSSTSNLSGKYVHILPKYFKKEAKKIHNMPAVVTTPPLRFDAADQHASGTSEKEGAEPFEQSQFSESNLLYVSEMSPQVVVESSASLPAFMQNLCATSDAESCISAAPIEDSDWLIPDVRDALQLNLQNSCLETLNQENYNSSPISETVDNADFSYPFQSSDTPISPAQNSNEISTVANSLSSPVKSFNASDHLLNNTKSYSAKRRRCQKRGRGSLTYSGSQYYPAKSSCKNEINASEHHSQSSNVQPLECKTKLTASDAIKKMPHMPSAFVDDSEVFIHPRKLPQLGNKKKAASIRNNRGRRHKK